MPRHFRSLGSILLCGLALAGTPALAQQQPKPQQELRTDELDLRPKEMQVPTSGPYQDLPLGPVPTELGQQPADDGSAISQQIFGPSVDAAYGAFQRGYYLTALELALPRAKNGDRVAQTLVAELFAKGLGVGEDPLQAAQWYGLASENGDALATFELAMMYQEGRGVAKDRKKAAELLEQSADAGNLSAKYNLGLLAIEGVYVKPDMVRAAKLIGEAAAGGIPEAEYDYAGLLAEGAGIAPDPVAAADFMGRAAEAGILAAQVDYATLLYLGKGIGKDRTAAVRWYQRAAEAGSPVAQNRYAKLLAVGEGVPLDLEEAAMWRAMARRQGLADPQLDKLLVSIHKDELDRAEERARFWPSEPPVAVAEASPAAGAPVATTAPSN